jgi:hypothetical protein
MRILARHLVPFLLLAFSSVSASEWINVQLNQDQTTELQNEEQIAINPTDPDNMVAVWRDFRLGYRQVAWAYTFDGGITWTEGGLFQEPNYPYQSDPGITVDAEGNFYAVILSFYSTSSENGLYVYKSTDGGITWSAPMEVVNQYPDAFEDKELIACDRTDSPHAGNLYVTWTRFSWVTQIMLRRSTNGGLTWGPTVPVSDGFTVQFPIPVVGRQGEVYVAWTDFYGTRIRIDKSTDGGVSFGTDRIVAEVYTTTAIINGGIDIYASPHMDADITDGPYSGRLYLVFTDRRDGLPDYDIWFTMSDDLGESWTEPVRLNDDPAGNGKDQFHPWLCVDNQGIVTVVFLDRRDDPQNLRYHCYLTQSTDGGTTWTPNVRISTQPSDPTYARANGAPPALDIPSITADRSGLIGEYIGVTSWDGDPRAVWTDIRNQNQDVFAARFLVGGAAPEPVLAGAGVRAYPNPVSAGRPVRFLGLPRGSVLLVTSSTGRLLRRLHGPVWDGRLADGRPAPAGMYFVATPQGGRAKILVVR